VGRRRRTLETGKTNLGGEWKERGVGSANQARAAEDEKKFETTTREGGEADMIVGQEVRTKKTGERK